MQRQLSRRWLCCVKNWIVCQSCFAKRKKFSSLTNANDGENTGSRSEMRLKCSDVAVFRRSSNQSNLLIGKKLVNLAVIPVEA
eukprot:COSAG02_NODE_2189_length_9564_cov_10.112097_3_plen_83_part_00